MGQYYSGADTYKLMDGDGLQLRIATDGTKTWLVRYFIGGRERQYRLPKPYGTKTDDGQLSLEDARHEAARIRALARQGIDYAVALVEQRAAEQHQREHAENEAKTLRDLFDAWLPEISVKRGRKGRIDGGAETKRTLEKDVMSALGGTLLTQFTKADVLRVVRKVSDRGANRLAVMIVRDVKQMFRWGNKNQPWKRLLVDSDVLAIEDADVVHGDYDPVEDNERTRALTLEEIRLLRDKLPASGLTIQARSAIWIMLACATRVGETLAARWENVDLDARLWHIPADNAKTKTPITIALSDFAARQFEALRGYHEEWVFPATRKDGTHVCKTTIGKQIADRQRPGEKPMKGRTQLTDSLVLPGGQWKCHDLRRTASTIMQSLGVLPEIIHRCQNHAQKEKLDRIYLQHDYANEMREAWRLLGERLELLTREGAENVIVMRSA